MKLEFDTEDQVLFNLVLIGLWKTVTSGSVCSIGRGSQDLSPIHANLFAVCIVNETLEFRVLSSKESFFTSLLGTIFQVFIGADVETLISSISSSNFGPLRVEDLDTGWEAMGRPGI